VLKAVLSRSLVAAVLACLAVAGSARAAICPNESFRLGAGTNLPDCRAYEQATPLAKNGSNMQGSQSLVVGSRRGDAITSYALGGIPGGVGSQEFPQYMSQRIGGAWETEGLLPPPSYGAFAFVMGWDEELSDTFIEAENTFTSPRELSFLTRERDGVIREIVPPTPEQGQYSLADASADGSKVLFETWEYGSTHLDPAALAERNVFIWDRSSGTRKLVDILPADEGGGPPPTGAFAGPYNWEIRGPSEGGSQEHMYMENVLSSNGSRAFFTVAGSGQLYARLNPMSEAATTLRVSESHKTTGLGPDGTDANGPSAAAFLSATPDGTYVFFSSAEKLTNDATTGPEPLLPTGEENPGRDLYRFDTNTGELKDLTPDAGDVNGAEVQGLLGVSESGEVTYFVANGVLAPGASHGNCLKGLGTCNLYVDDSGAINYIGTLKPDGISPDSDVLDWVLNGSKQVERASRISADGRTLVFQSSVQQTSYDNDGTPEFYRFRMGEGVSCLTCNQNGNLPTGTPTLRSIDTQAGLSLFPRSTLTRNLSASGSRFLFETPEALLPSDTNATLDVYEWEEQGSGSCSSSAYEGGCLYLISPGTSANPSYFADADAEGNNVFIFTTQRLVPQDEDELLDVYDVSVDGGLQAQYPLSVPGCNGEACQGPPSSQPTITSPGSNVSLPSETISTRKKKHQKKKHQKKKSQGQRQQQTKKKANGRKRSARKGE
jgi:hypothetical protein